jgi:hypothetical protein
MERLARFGSGGSHPSQLNEPLLQDLSEAARQPFKRKPLPKVVSQPTASESNTTSRARNLQLPASECLVANKSEFPNEETSWKASSDGRIKEGYVSSANSSSCWRPWWVRRRLFWVFGVWFAMLAVTIEALYMLSSQQSGISEPSRELFYLWTFGPTSGKMIMPWSLADQYSD